MKKTIASLVALLVMLLVLCSVSADSAENIPVKAIKLESNSISLLLGAQEEAARGQIKLTVTPENTTTKVFSFESDNESVVTVDSEGNLQAVGTGKAKITIIPQEENTRVKAFCNVTVGNAVTEIQIPAKQTVEKNKTFGIKPVVLPQDAASKNVTYSSSDEKIATVNKQGVVKGLECGTAIITCSAADGSGVSSTCEITVIQPVSKLVTDTKRLIMFEGSTCDWKVSVAPDDATDKKLEYASTTSAVSIDENGKLTANSAGKAKITATTTDGSNRTCTCDVIVEPAIPVTIDSLAHGIYNYNLLGITVTNHCSVLTVTNFEFELTMIEYNGIPIYSGDGNLGNDDRIGPGRQKVIKRTAYGAGQAFKTIFKVKGVTFSDGTHWDIPEDRQEETVFTRK